MHHIFIITFVRLSTCFQTPHLEVESRHGDRRGKWCLHHVLSGFFKLYFVFLRFLGFCEKSRLP